MSISAPQCCRPAHTSPLTTVPAYQLKESEGAGPLMQVAWPLQVFEEGDFTSHYPG